MLSPRPAPLPFDLTWTDLEDALPEGAIGDSAVVSHVKRGQHQGGHPSVIVTLYYNAPSGHPGQRTLFCKLNPHDSREAERYRFLTDHGLPVPHLAVCIALDAIGSGHPNHAPATWFNTYRRAVVPYQDLPTALTHGELAPQHLGRTEDGALIMFDLATVGRRPRFADIANLLATLAHLAGKDEKSILGDYLTYLARGSRAPTLDEQTWAELQLARFVQAVEALPWYLSLQQPAELHQHLRTIATDHPATLAQLDP